MSSINATIKNIIEKSKYMLSTPLSSILIRINKEDVIDKGKYYIVRKVWTSEKYDEIRLQLSSWNENITFPKNYTFRSLKTNFDSLYYNTDLNEEEYNGHKYFIYKRVKEDDKLDYFDSGELLDNGFLQNYILPTCKFEQEK